MSLLYEQLRQLITLIDELRDVGLQHYISLPRIAAIGTQSSGKSSLIESIVGLDFLPRGGGVVTRRPLELRLVHLNSMEYEGDQSWAIFDTGGKTEKFYDFNKVRDEIERQTDLVAGSNKGIVNDPIILTVYATGAPDLTLIDLPGITRVALKGSDQVQDIEKLTRDMTLHYIQDPRTIILAVVPANMDMSVSDALQLARQVDPQGLRTIGVVTKIDIMDQGTDACKMLRGEEIPLRLGYVGVKMRSQQDITNRKPVAESLNEEKAWFENHRLYGKLPPGLVGTRVLIDKLTQVLFKHIRRFLPEIKKEINEKRRSVQDRMDELGQGVPLEEHERVQVMWTMITDYCELFKNTIRGRLDRKLQRYMMSETGRGSDMALSGGARVRATMNDFLQDFADTAITHEMSDEDIDKAIRMHEGDSLPGFPSPDTFEYLALPHLAKLTIPSVECVHNVAAALDILASRIAQAVFRRFPKLADCALEMTQNIVAREKEATKEIVEKQVLCYTGYLFTNDLSYLTEHGSMEAWYNQGKKEAPPPEPEKPPEPSRMEQTFQQVKDGSKMAYSQVREGAAQLMGNQQAPRRKEARYSGPYVDEIRKRLDAYFAITVRNIRDSVPKAIGFYLVRAVQDKLQFELIQALNRADKISELLGEPPHILEERKTLHAQLQVLMKSSGVLSRDPTLAAIAFEAEIEDERTQAAPSQPRAAPAPTRTTSAPGGGAAPTASRGSMPGAGPGRDAPAAAASPAATAVKRNDVPAPTTAGAGYPVSPSFSGGSAAPSPSASAPQRSSGLFGEAAPAPPAQKGLFDDAGPVPKATPSKAGTKNPLFGD